MSSRRTRHSNKKKPNPAYYVGYVEDDETPEMIMRKFEELEKIRLKFKEEKAQNATKIIADSSNNNVNSKAEMSDNEEPFEYDNEALPMDQLVNVFRNTSMYSMNSLKRNNEIFFDKPMISEDGFMIGIKSADIRGLRFDVDYEVCKEDMLDFFPQTDSDYSERDFSEDDKKSLTKIKRKQRIGGIRRRTGSKRSTLPNYRNSSGFGSSRRKRRPRKIRYSFDTNRQQYPRYPVPRSWGLTVQPFQSQTERDEMKNCIYQEGDILTMKHAEYANGKTYTGIILDPPFDLSRTGIVDKTVGTITIDEFGQIPIDKLMPEGGIIFIWTPAELIPQMIKICKKWSFIYVEIATWINKDQRGGVCNEMTNCFTKCTDNLLLFRKIKSVNGKTRDYYHLDMLHQRTPDTFFDFVRYHPITGQRLKSNMQYTLVERMIWCFTFKDQINLLYLWAPKNEKREGWHMVCDLKHEKFLAQLKANEENDEENYW